MSLSKIQEPDIVTPVNNPVPIVFLSNLASQDGFRYKVLLYNSGGTVETEVWLYPDSRNNNYLIYDFSNLLTNLLGTNIENWNATGFVENKKQFYKYYYDVIEYIGSTSGDTYNSTTPLYVFKGVKQYGEYWDMNDYSFTTGNTGLFLSNKLKRKYKLTEYGNINSFFGDFTSIINTYDKVMINAYTSSLGKTFFYKNELPSYSKNGIFTLPIGPKQLNSMANDNKIYYGSSGLPVGTDIITDDILWYEIYLRTGSTQIVSERIRIDVDHNYYKHDGVEFLYVGDLGTLETLSARMANVESYKTDKNEIKLNKYNILNDKYTYNVGDRGRKNINVTTIVSNTVITDWIKDDECLDIIEMLRSPEVYIIKADKLYPIIITTSSYEHKSVKNNRLYNYTISFEMAYEKLSNI